MQNLLKKSGYKLTPARLLILDIFSKSTVPLNAEIVYKKLTQNKKVKNINEVIPLGPEIKQVLDASAKAFDLSARSYHKTIKLARTIADLEERENVERDDILEALQYRPKRQEI